MKETITTGKPKCNTCKKPKQVTLDTQPFTKEEMDFAMTLVDKRGLNDQEQNWLVNLNNRVLNDNKMVGCGKCLVQVGKNLKNAYQRMYGDKL
jgi:hypothetical protein